MPSLPELVATRDKRLAHRAISLVRERGLATYAPPLAAEWEAAGRALAGALATAWRERGAGPHPGLWAEQAGGGDAEAFGAREARRHRAHGTTLPRLLGLLKAWRQACLELAEECGPEARDFTLAFFDAAELGAADEWTAPAAPGRERELAASSRRLALENGRLSALVASLPHPVLQVEPDGFLAARNAAAARLFPAAGPGPQRAPPWLARRLAPLLAGAVPHLSFEEDLPGQGGPRRFAVGAEPVDDVAHRFGGATVWLEDVTERRALEDRLQAAARLATVGALAAGVAHELAGPLASVQSGLSVLAGELDELRARLPPERAADLVETAADARQAAAQATRIVRGMQALSVQGEEELEPVLVGPALRAAAAEAARRLPGRLELAVGDLPPVWGREELLGQVFRELLERVAGSPSAGAALRVEARAEGEAVRVTAEGASPPGPEAEPGGDGSVSGVGLSLCQATVDAFGGSVRLEPGPGGGTRAVVTLRAALLPEPAQAAVAG